MPNFAAALIIAVVAMHQKDTNLLPAPVHLAGSVVDCAGNPFPEAIIVLSNSKGRPPQTDAGGHFAFDTDAPAVVIQKPGFWGQRIEVGPTSDLRITLQPSPLMVPICAVLS